MRKTVILGGAALMLVLLVSTEGTQALSMTFRGSIEDLLAKCTTEGATLDYSEFYGRALCVYADETWVFCEDNGSCARGGPREYAGGRGFRTRDHRPSESLVDTGGSSSETGVISDAPVASAPSAPTPPIF